MCKKKQKFYQGIWLVLGFFLLFFGSVNAHALTSLPAPPDSTKVHWQPNSALARVTLENGATEEVAYLTLEGTNPPIPAHCLGLGVPLTDSSTSAQRSKRNAIWNKLTAQQKAVINNIGYLARSQGEANNMELYLGASLAIWQKLYDYHDATHVPTDFVFTEGLPQGNKAKVLQYKADLIKKAEQMVELPSFNGTTVQLIQGVEKTLRDKNGVLGYFPYTKNNVSGLEARVSGNNLSLKANTSTNLGVINNAFAMQNIDNNIPDDELPYFLYSTNGDETGTVSQTVIASQDPSRSVASLNLNIIGLGSFSLNKEDADTKSTQTQGSASLQDSVWGVYKKGTNDLVHWPDGQAGYPITLVSGEKADSSTLQIKMVDVEKGIEVKNLNKAQSYEVGEIKAPEGYALSTKRYPITFDKNSPFDNKTGNSKVHLTATDRPLTFNFMFDKVQGINGSLTGLNDAEFTLTPQKGTQGKPITAISQTGTDSNGYTINGLVTFDGQANQKAGNPSKEGIVLGHYLLSETKTPQQLQPIHDVDVNVSAVRNEQKEITSYQGIFKDAVTQQLIDEVTIPVEKMKDQSLLFKVNLGQFTDQSVTPVIPTITTEALTKHGKHTLALDERSKETVLSDQIKLTNVKVGPTEISTLHRLVRDKSSKIKEDKPVATLEVPIDESIVQQMENTVEAKVDTTKDGEVSDDESVSYVWKTLIKQGDQVLAKHEDLNDTNETLLIPQGHTQVSEATLLPKADQRVNDVYYAKGLTIGEAYQVTVTSAWDHQAKKEIPIKQVVMFTATKSEMTAPIPLTIDGSKVAGHDLTFFENLKDLDGNLLVENKNPNDKRETIHVKAVPLIPAIVKKVIASLPKTGEGKADLAISIFGAALLGLVVYLKRHWIVSTFRKAIRKIRN